MITGAELAARALIAGCVGLDNKEKLDLQDMPQEAVIKPMVKKAFASQKVCCINVMTDPTTVSPASTMLANVGAYKA